MFEGTIFQPDSLKICRYIASQGYEEPFCWVNPIALPLEDKIHIVVSKLLVTRCDCVRDISLITGSGSPVTWTAPRKIGGLGRIDSPDGSYVQTGTSGLYRCKDGRILLLANQVRYNKDDWYQLERQTSMVRYAFFNPETATISDLKILENIYPGSNSLVAGNPQIKEIDGKLMMALVSSRPCGDSIEGSLVMTSFHLAPAGDIVIDEYSPETLISGGRGIHEPDFIRFHGKWYWTLRNDRSGYAAVSDGPFDKLEPRKWLFDDGTWLGNYNTMTRFLTVRDKLFLIYTRKGLHNDHVFRHRAPLLIGQVDTDRLCIIKDTEQILVPEMGARLCNYSTASITPDKAFIAVAEWMQGPGNAVGTCEQYGADNRVWYVTVE